MYRKQSVNSLLFIVMVRHNRPSNAVIDQSESSISQSRVISHYKSHAVTLKSDCSAYTVQCYKCKQTKARASGSNFSLSTSNKYQHITEITYK